MSSRRIRRLDAFLIDWFLVVGSPLRGFCFDCDIQKPKTRNKSLVASVITPTYDAPVVTVLYTLGSVILVSLISLLGILFFLVREEVIRRWLLTFVSFSTGGLLGDVFIHMFPEMAAKSASFSHSLFLVLGGILFSFVVEKLIHWRHCHLLPEDSAEREHRHDVGAMSILGDAMHNFIDGLVIAAAYLVGIPIGISTTLAVVFHEIPHEIGNFAVLLHSGYGRRRALLLNLLSALAAVGGAVIALAGSAAFVSLGDALLPFAAGNLLYVAGSDLIPELHREEGLGRAALQLVSMIGGIGVMQVLLVLG